MGYVFRGLNGSVVMRPSQEILKIRDGTPLEAEEILTYIKRPSKRLVLARILFFKIRQSQEILKIPDCTPLEAEEILTYLKKPSQEILKIRDGIPLEAEEILTYIKSPRNGSVCYFSSKLDVPSNVVQKKRVARILFFKIRPSQEILKIPDGTPLEAEEILTYLKKSSKRIDLPSQEILKIRDGTPLEPEEILTNIKKPSKRIGLPSQEILKIRDGTPMEAEEILTYIKRPSKRLVCYFSSKLYVPSNVVHRKRVARILFFKIRPSQEILKIPDGTPLVAEEILTYLKNNVVQKKRVARILFFKIRPSQEILKFRDGTPLEAEEILTYIKKPSKRSVCYLYSKFDVPSNVVQKKRVARILFFKIRPSQEILKIRDGTPLEAEEILTYIKNSSKRIDLPSQEILKIRDGTPLEAEEILTYIKKPSKRIEPSQEILKIRDGTPLEAEEILTYIKRPSKRLVCYFSSKLYVPSNVVHRKRVARILFFKIRPSQEILKIPDGTPLEAEEILTYLKNNVVQKKRVARILFFKIRPSQEILKFRDGTPLEAEEILTYIKKPSKRSVCYLYSKFDVPSNVVQKKRVARILFFKIRPSQEILKIRDGTPLEAEEILTYIKNSSKQIDLVARILFFKIRPSQEILKIRDGTPMEMPSQEILKIRDGTPLEAEEILTYIKRPSKRLVCYFSSKLYVPSNVVHRKRVARILFFKIRPSQEILKIPDGTPLEAEEILTYLKNNLDVPSNVVQKKRVARILFFKIRPSQEILKFRDGTPLEAEEILTYIKKPSKRSVCYLYSKFDVPSNVVQKKRVARILFFKIRPSQEILKIRDGTPLEAEEILTYIKNSSKRIDLPSQEILKIRDGTPLEMPSQEILKIRDGTPLEAEEILTYIKRPSKRLVCYFSSKLYVPSNVVHRKRVARILFFKIRPSQEILKIPDGTPLEAEEILTYLKKPSQEILKIRDVARILFFKIRPSQEILKIRDGTPMEAEEILTYIKRPSKRLVCYFSSKLYVPSNVVHRKRVARILFFKIRPSQEILKIPDGTPLEAEEILTYLKKSSKRIDFNVVQKKRVARILFFKIRPSQEILKFRDGTPLEAEEILTYIKKPSKRSVCYLYSKFDVPSNVVQKKRVARILFFKIRPSQEILKIRDGTPLEAEEILTYIKNSSKRIDLPSQEILKIRDGTPLEAEEILTYIKKPSKRIEPSQEILKIRDGTPLEAEEILTYIKRPSKRLVCYFSSKLYVPSNVVHRKRVARILFFKIRPSQEILKIPDGTPLEAEEILTYLKKSSKRIDLLLF
ncbi:hypothetical protein OROHE_004227 [Orobanche hederae]